MFLLWVELRWVAEFSIVVLLIQCFLCCLGKLKEVGDVEAVGEVLVEVVLVVLEGVHLLVNEVVSSNSWEGEGLIVKFKGVDVNLWVLSLLLKLFVDLHGVLIVLHVESS